MKFGFVKDFASLLGLKIENNLTFNNVRPKDFYFVQGVRSAQNSFQIGPQ